VYLIHLTSLEHRPSTNGPDQGRQSVMKIGGGKAQGPVGRQRGLGLGRGQLASSPPAKGPGGVL